MALLPDERITVALVRGLHGLRGAVRVEVLSDAPDRFAPGTILYAENDEQPLTVAWAGPAKPGLLLRFTEVTSREAAEPLRDRYLEAIPGEPLPEGSWYWHEIEGLEARSTDDEVLGRVSEVYRAGGGEVYVVTGGPRGEILVPAVRGVVTELSPADGRLIVDAAALGMSPTPPTHPGAEPVAGGEIGADSEPAVDPDAAEPMAGPESGARSDG